MTNTADLIPHGMQDTHSRFSEEERKRWFELKGRTDLTSDERSERAELRLKIASGYRDYHFPPAETEEHTPPPCSAVAYFPSAPAAPTFVGREVTGYRAHQIRLRLFGPRTRTRQPAVTQPARAVARPRERRDGSRRHATRGSTDDGPGEPSPSDLAAPCCSKCGTELLAAASLCGLCAVEAQAEVKRSKGAVRTCAHPDCDRDISHRRADAQTCEQPGHKKWLQREKKKPPYTACEDCGRRWLSDLNPRHRPCPDCGGAVVLGRTMPLQATVGRVVVPADPLADIDRDVWACVYSTDDVHPIRHHEHVDFQITKPPECASRSCRWPALGETTAFCWQHTRLERLDNLVPFDRFRDRHARFVAHLALAPPNLSTPSDSRLAVAA